jgi:hypothetical protein
MADTLDILTDPEARQILSVGALDDTRADLLTALITTASRRLDEGCGPVVRRSVTSETVKVSGCHAELHLGPVTAISSVTEDGTALSAADWYAEPYRPNPTLYSGIIVRRAGDYAYPWETGMGRVTVGYLAGRFASTATVEAKYKQACGLILKNLWRTYESNVGLTDEFEVPHESFPTTAVPKVVRELLAEEWQTHVGFGA